MAKVRLKPRRLLFQAPIVLASISLLSTGVLAGSSLFDKALPSPPVNPELICHSDNPAECYPKVFYATNEFQVLRDDQHLPSGLHVRMNLETGKKEAKINVPGERDSELEGLPVDSSVVVVDSGEAQQVHIPPNAPKYDAAGKIKTPHDESLVFYKSLSILKKGLDIDGALEILEDISHDVGALSSSLSPFRGSRNLVSCQMTFCPPSL
jgi:nucleotide exchange factor SIL1